jgi:hypothetical protein
MKTTLTEHGSKENYKGGGMKIFFLFELAEIRDRRHHTNSNSIQITILLQ